MTDAEEFIVICLNAAVLKNVLVGLHEIRGDYLEKATIVDLHLKSVSLVVLNVRRLLELHWILRCASVEDSATHSEKEV